jgi:HEAT repeat protein
MRNLPLVSVALSLAGVLYVPPAEEIVAGERATTQPVIRPVEKSDNSTGEGVRRPALSRSDGTVVGARILPEAQLTYENLARMFRSDDYRQRYAAAENLTRTTMHGWKGTKEQANELAVAGLKDPYWATRYEAAKFIYSRGNLAEATIPALIEALKSDEPLVRNQCVLALQRTGGAMKAFREFQQMLIDGDQLDAVATVLLESGSVGRKALTAAADSQNANVRLWSKAALAKGGAESGGYMKELTAALKSGRKDRVLNACKSIELAGNRGAAAGMLLANLLTDRDIDLRLAAVRALRDAAPKDKAVVDALVNGMRDKDICDICLVALGRIGPKAASAIPDLLDLIEKDERARYGVLLALERIDPKSPAALPVLLRVLKKTSEKRPDKAVIAAIGVYGPAAKAAVPDLVTALYVKSSHPYYVDAAIWALGQIGPDARAARSDVLKFIPGPFAETARVAMKRIDAQDPATMPAPEVKYTGRTLKMDF